MLAAASQETGELHYMTLRDRGFRKDDVIAFLKILKLNFKHVHLAILLDNHMSFKSKDVMTAAYDLDIVLLYQIPERPEFNGMKDIWTHVYAHYGHEKGKYLNGGRSWDNQ